MYRHNRAQNLAVQAKTVRGLLGPATDLDQIPWMDYWVLLDAKFPHPTIADEGGFQVSPFWKKPVNIPLGVLALGHANLLDDLGRPRLLELTDHHLQRLDLDRRWGDGRRRWWAVGGPLARGRVVDRAIVEAAAAAETGVVVIERRPASEQRSATHQEDKEHCQTQISFLVHPSLRTQPTQGRSC